MQPSYAPLDLCGMKDLEVTDDFVKLGGSERQNERLRFAGKMRDDAVFQAIRLLIFAAIVIAMFAVAGFCNGMAAWSVN